MACQILSVSASTRGYNQSRRKAKVCCHFRRGTSPVVGILHSVRSNIFPSRPFFLQRRGTVADFHPAHGPVLTDPRFIHVAQVFAFGNRSLPEGLALNSLNQLAFADGLNTGSNQVSIERIVDRRFLIEQDDRESIRLLNQQ